MNRTPPLCPALVWGAFALPLVQNAGIATTLAAGVFAGAFLNSGYLIDCANGGSPIVH
jgi:hypothetical protein